MFTAREAASIFRFRLRVFQREFFLAHKTKTGLRASGLAAVIMGVRRLCSRILRLWKEDVGRRRLRKKNQHVLDRVREKFDSLRLSVLVELCDQRLLVHSFMKWKDATEPTRIEALVQQAQTHLGHVVKSKWHRAVVCEHFAAWKYVVLPCLRHLMIGRALQAW